MRKKRKNVHMKKRCAVCTHLCFFKGDFLRGKKSLSSLRSLHHHDVFLHFSKGRERERLIFVERTTLINKSTRRARAQSNETGNT